MDLKTRRWIFWARILFFGLFFLVIGSCVYSTFTDISIQNATPEQAGLGDLPSNAAKVSLHRPSMTSGKSEVFLEFDTDEKSFEKWRTKLPQELKPVKKEPVVIHRYDFEIKKSYPFTLGSAASYHGNFGLAAVDVAFDRKLNRVIMHSYKIKPPTIPPEE